MEKGKLKIFFGYYATVGKTKKMLEEVLNLNDKYRIILIADLNLNFTFKDCIDKMMRLILTDDNKIDVNQIIRVNPDLVIFDNLADNSKQLNNQFRYQDIITILDCGIDVYTTLNVFNLNSIKYLVDHFIDYSNVGLIPDYIFNEADEICFIDFNYQESLPISFEQASLLRMLALRKVISHNNKFSYDVKFISPTKFLLIIDLSCDIKEAILKTAKLAGTLVASFDAIYVINKSNYDEKQLNCYKELIKQQNGRFIKVYAQNRETAVLQYIKQNGINNVVIVKNSRYERSLIKNLAGYHVHLINIKLNQRKPRLSFDVSKMLIGLLAMSILIILAVIKPLYIQISIIGLVVLLLVIIGLIRFGHNLMIKRNLKHVTKMEQINVFNQELLKANTKDQLFNSAIKFFRSNYAINLSFYQKKQQLITKYSQEDNNIITDKQKSIITSIYDNHQIAGYQQQNFPDIKEIYYPILIKEDIFAVVEFSQIEDYQAFYSYNYLIDTFLVQFGLILEKNLLVNEREQLVNHVKNETIKNSFLYAISHDLRTPLTSIYSRIETILEQDLPKEVVTQILKMAKGDINWLIQMAQNLLTISRINQLHMISDMKDEIVEEVVSDAVSQVKKRFCNNIIDIVIPNEILICKMDAILIKQVLINLLENAIKHNCDALNVKLEVIAHESSVVFRVIDEGINQNISKLDRIFNETPHFFDNEYNSNDNSQIGIGLSICKTIIKAHHGQFGYYKNKRQGLTFFFSLAREQLNEFKQD